MSMWRRFLIEGPEKFGDLYYLGTAPVVGRQGLMDVLVAAHGDIECRFYVDPADGQLAAMEMIPEEDTDPAELYFGEYKEIDGRMFPGRIEARHGDDYLQMFQCREFTFAPAAPVEEGAE